MTKSQLRSRTRATGPKDKSERRAAIVRAAEELLHRHPGGAMSVEELARRAGLAKGTVYLYFQTREEVLLQVHLARLHGLFDALEQELAAPQANAAYGAVRATLRYLRAHPEFLPLAVNCRGMLEANAGAEAALEFRLALGARLGALGARIEARHPGMSAGEGVALLMGTYALMIGLWQLTDSPACLRDALQRPELEMFRADFEKLLATALLAQWAGAAPISAGTP